MVTKVFVRRRISKLCFFLLNERSWASCWETLAKVISARWHKCQQLLSHYKLMVTVESKGHSSWLLFFFLCTFGCPMRSPAARYSRDECVSSSTERRCILPAYTHNMLQWNSWRCWIFFDILRFWKDWVATILLFPFPTERPKIAISQLICLSKMFIIYSPTHYFTRVTTF